MFKRVTIQNDHGKSEEVKLVIRAASGLKGSTAESLNRMLCKGSTVALVMYDVTDLKSFDFAQYQINQVESYV